MLLPVASLKGGTGKSTIAVNLACVFAVPVVDADDRPVGMIDVQDVVAIKIVG